jgi:hypothetical protein
MTIITRSSPHYTVKVTENTNALAEKLGYNIADAEFVADAQQSGDHVRGYVFVEIFGMVRRKVGPITLLRSDLQEWKR